MTMNTVPAVKYHVSFYNSEFDFNDGHKSEMEEIFIPSTKISFNTFGYIFISETEREDGVGEITLTNRKAIDLPAEFVEKISTIAQKQLEAQTMKKEVESRIADFLNS